MRLVVNTCLIFGGYVNLIYEKPTRFISDAVSNPIEFFLFFASTIKKSMSKMFLQQKMNTTTPIERNTTTEKVIFLA